jgi:hypothetical protein
MITIRIELANTLPLINSKFRVESSDEVDGKMEKFG